ncbi:hypothetical protein BJF79_22580 [Actinomadura sp. CNU-125]|uniref:NTP transferase domain-containing protein n=1 Tax=Actinomadura sp. CNU-125 TaxID=1904961 RepID=UPI00096751E4|nr:NTP transferase domain-containing protein [Actinomadura sp. CNU-125]OLT12299.1 hypothetical protein BJF79_22580 [Actinomadura sp. CNU-125]
MNDQVCAVVPAAGRGSRLGLGVPKILLDVAAGVTVWDVLYRRIAPHVGHVHVVVSPDGAEPFRRRAAAEIGAGAVSVSVQETPTGMGDAIFGAHPHWAGHAAVLVVWGDQANLSAATVRRVVAAHRAGGLTIPLVPMPDPYVEYELDGRACCGCGSRGRATRAGPAGSATSARSAWPRTVCGPRGRATSRARSAARSPGRSTSCRSSRTCRGWTDGTCPWCPSRTRSRRAG